MKYLIVVIAVMCCSCDKPANHDTNTQVAPTFETSCYKLADANMQLGVALAIEMSRTNSIGLNSRQMIIRVIDDIHAKNPYLTNY